MNKSYFFKAVRITVPVFFGYTAIGIPFGLTVVNSGYPWWIALVMSVTMYAGAGQYIAIGLFAAGATPAAIVVTELFVNIRHIVYGLSLVTKFKHTGAWKPFLIFGLTDETYALLTGCSVPEHVNEGTFYGTITLLDYLYWITGSVIGAVAGTLLPFSFAGVDFALTALFTVLLIDQLRATKDMLTASIGICVTTGIIIVSRTGLLSGQHILISALVTGMAVLILIRGRQMPKKEDSSLAEKSVAQ